MENKQLSIKELEAKAKETRRLIIEMLAKAGSGHPGGSLSATDLVVALYFNILRFNPKDPQWPDRDRFHMSKGHCCPLWYTVLAQTGYFPKEELMTLRQIGSNLQGHPSRMTPGVESASGSLGQGLSIGLGMSLAAKMDKKDLNKYIDGKLAERKKIKADINRLQTERKAYISEDEKKQAGKPATLDKAIIDAVRKQATTIAT